MAPLSRPSLAHAGLISQHVRFVCAESGMGNTANASRHDGGVQQSLEGMEQMVEEQKTKEKTPPMKSKCV